MLLHDIWPCMAMFLTCKIFARFARQGATAASSTPVQRLGQTEASTCWLRVRVQLRVGDEKVIKILKGSNDSFGSSKIRIRTIRLLSFEFAHVIYVVSM